MLGLAAFSAGWLFAGRYFPMLSFIGIAGGCGAEWTTVTNRQLRAELGWQSFLVIGLAVLAILVGALPYVLQV